MLTEDPARARAITAELDAINAERRAVEQRILWDAESQVAELGARPGYVLWSEDWHPGVVGIVASRIVESHHRPAVLVAVDGDTGGGSGRSIPGFDLLGALDAGAAHLRRYGGHRAAAGLTIDAARLEAFRAAFEAHAEAVLTPDLLERVERVDAVVSGHELGLGLAEELEALEPCGMGNPSPRLLVPGGRFDDVRPMGEGRHARFSVVSGGARARAVAFGCDGHVTDDSAQPLDATFRLERNVLERGGRAPAGAAPRPAVHARRDRARRRRPGPTAICRRRWPRSMLCSTARRRRRRHGARGAGPHGGRLSRATARWRCSSTRRRAGARSWRCARTSRGGCRACASASAASRWPPTASLPGGRSGRGARLRPRRRASIRPPAPPVTGRCAPEAGLASLAWGEPEMRFAEQMLDHEYGLRASLVPLYRALRACGSAAGAELERLLRGDSAHGRSAQLAGRLVRVLSGA